jgi:hypothetical protein
LKSYPFIILLLLGGLLSGCATTEQMLPLTFNPDQHARIRVFHGTSVHLYLGDICKDDTLPAINAAAGGFSYLVRNKRIGMPATDNIPFSYHEYTIPAGQPMTVKMYWQVQNANGTWQSCGPEYSTFTPEAGHDYDTFMKFSGGACQGVVVRKFVVDSAGKITTRFAPLTRPAFRRCS